MSQSNYKVQANAEIFNPPAGYVGLFFSLENNFLSYKKSDGSIVNLLNTGIIPGGTTGQILAKASGTDFDTHWINPPAATWGSITGTLSAQSDLQTALNAKYDSSNPSGFQTAGQVTTAVNSGISTHVGLSDPHPQYASDADLTAGLATKANATHTHNLSQLNQSGATNNQIPRWNGTDWVPSDESGGGAWGSITGTLSAQADLQTALDSKQDDILSNDREYLYNNSGVLTGDSDLKKRLVTKGIDAIPYQQPNGENDNRNIHSFDSAVGPLAASPNLNYNLHWNQLNLDNNNTGFALGNYGLINQQIYNHGKSDVNDITGVNTSFSFGNGTDALTVNSFKFFNSFGQIASGVTIDDSFQGYGFSPSIQAGSIINSSAYLQAFYDNCNINTQCSSYQSFNASPYILEMTNNHWFNGFNLNATIDTFSGNSGFNGVNVSPNLGTFNTAPGGGSFNGVSVNPTIDMVKYANGIYVSMDNVTVYPGVKASATIQDIKIECIEVGTDGNSISIEYTGGGTAGSEVVSNIGLNFSVQIQSGVSTATQVKAALDAYVNFTLEATATITGVGSNPQVTQAQTFLASGDYAGQKRAAFFDGDVHVDGDLTFSGALQIGKLNAYAAQAIINGGGLPQSIHNLISQPTVAANTTVAMGDTFGINTAMLVDMGANSHVTTTFIGLSALALPAVVNMGAGSTVDKVAGATFALSLDSAAGGGTISELSMCRALAIPNGVTTVTSLYGYKFELPFGDPGTTTWGLHISAGNNYLSQNLKIGGTDLVANPSVGLELESSTKAVLLSRMDTTARNALTAIDGMMIYNTTTNKFQGYASGAWVDLH